MFLPDSVLEDCMFLEMYLFFLGCQICWHIIVCMLYLNDHFYFYGIGCNFSLFIADFICFCPLFILDKYGWRFVDFVHIFKESAFSFIYLSSCCWGGFVCFFVFDFFLGGVRISSISPLIFIIFILY